MSEKVREQGAQFIGMYIGIQKAPQSGKAKIGEKKKKSNTRPSCPYKDRWCEMSRIKMAPSFWFLNINMPFFVETISKLSQEDAG